MKRIEHKRGSGQGSGFTLIELLVSISILAILALMAVPAVQKYFRAAVYRKSELVLRTLEGACEYYKSDFDDYPPSGGNNLVKFLASLGDEAQDMQDGPGFRTKRRGEVYGPYNDADRMQMTPSGWGGARYFIDGYDNPICYYRFNPETTTFGSDSMGPSNSESYMRSGGDVYRDDSALCTMGFNKRWDPPSAGDSDDVTNFQLK